MLIKNWIRDKINALFETKIEVPQTSANTDSNVITPVIIYDNELEPELELVNVEKVEEEPVKSEAFEVEQISVNLNEEEEISVQEPVVLESYAPELDLPDYKFPTLDLLDKQEASQVSAIQLEGQKNTIIQTLRGFGYEISKICVTVEPSVKLYEIILSNEGVKINSLKKLSDDIARSLLKSSIKIYSLNEKGTIAIEVPNEVRDIVRLRNVLASSSFIESGMTLPIVIGKKMNNENFFIDLAEEGHILIGGSTGQGKTTLLDCIILSLLYKKHPSQIKFVLVGIGFPVYEILNKHFLAVNPRNKEFVFSYNDSATEAISALCIEMNKRYELLKDAAVRNWKEYNQKFINRKLDPFRGHKYLPALVLIIDEIKDIIQWDKGVEKHFETLTRMAKPVGIHLIISTQRASSKIISSAIKENISTLIGFNVPSKIDSNILLDNDLASGFTGIGEAIYQRGSENIRVQCCFSHLGEIEKVTKFIGLQKGYAAAYLLPEGNKYLSEKRRIELTNRDKLFEDCARAIVQMQNGSTSNLQRRFNLGYNRAGKIMDQLEVAGIVGPAIGSKPREVYFNNEGELEAFLNEILTR